MNVFIYCIYKIYSKIAKKKLTETKEIQFSILYSFFFFWLVSLVGVCRLTCCERYLHVYSK